LTACKLLVSDSISLPSPGFFSPFPHGTGSLSVINEYLALEGGPPRFKPGFTCPVLLRYWLESLYSFRLRDYHPVSRHFPEPSAKCGNYLLPALQPRRKILWFGLFPFRSPLLRESSFDFFSSAYVRCFSSAGLASLTYVFS
jgi:hypothetical protein